MLSALLPLARFAPSVIGTVAEFFISGSGSVAEDLAERGKNWVGDRHAAAEKAEILQALQITEEKLNAFDRMFIALGRDCGQLLDRVAELEAKGQDPSDELAKVVLHNPELQSQFDNIGQDLARLEKRVDRLEGDVKRLDEQYASVGAFAAELKQKQLSDTELADFRAFRKTKQFQLTGNYSESETILLKLANSQPKSAAVAVALAVAKQDDPQSFQIELKRAQRLRPDDANLQALASAATVAVTSRKTPASRRIPAVIRLPKAGDTLDGWQFEEKLGGGGWGIVFRATKRGQTRAVKVMRPDLADNSEFVETFTDEVFKLLRVRHLNLIAVERNGFCTSFMCHYFVMPLLEGLNLEQHLDLHGKPTDDVAMAWLTGLLDGLEHAHTNGLIHRDIKPANVMILSDGTPVLIDFGIAGLHGVAGYTQAVGVSRLFAPPEQQSLGQADVRSDLYSLAATIFYALRHDHPLHERLAHEYEAELVPAEFRKAFDAALAVKRSRRPTSAAPMRELLRVSEAELESEREMRAAAESLERERLEKARQEAERERQRQAAEEAVRKRLEHDEMMCKLNLDRWLATDAPEQWVSAHLPSWDEPALRQLLLDLRLDGRYWPMDETGVSRYMLGVRDRLVEQKRRAEEYRIMDVALQQYEAERDRLAAEARKLSERKAGERMEVALPGGVKMAFAWCPAGKFLMGSPATEKERRDDEQRHEVKLTRGFWMGVHPVTQAQYQAVMGTNPSHFKGDMLPVEQVSWEDAVAFCVTLKQKTGVELRLPTEAEWEYAARGGTVTPFYWGTELNGKQGNCNGNYPYDSDTKGPYLGRTTPVGSYAGKYPHPWGLTDVIGNVWEWCADWYGTYPDGAVVDPVGPESGSVRVRRGGSWNYYARLCRAAYRGGNSPDDRYCYLGFRLAVVPSGE